MGFATKKSKRWELQQLAWTFISILMFVPLPVHIFPFVMLAQARKSKIQSWYATGVILLLVEVALFASFVYFFGTLSQAMLLTLGGSVTSYIVGNGLLLNRARPYLQRLELAEVRPLAWIPTAASRNKMQLLPQAVLDTPQLFIERLMHWRKEIDNRAMHRDIDKIIHLFQLLEQSDKMEAERFLVRHSTVVNVLMKYDEIENSRLNNSVTAESKKKLEDVIAKAAIAIEQEVTNQFKSGILDVSAETDVYIQSLKNRNLLNE
ncbi:hypothetical protein [Sphingobacterium paludis]|jgi:hypothetical protein|uniref:5-bromo-4-chloroindolyl phosphate hydrolysis protein n=1 Tax=Sphingobacterium paludis TaxID=1476465 RepID=A0A4R7CTN8_9SPHI|nr:hypothetical protein [Sphingobacterium paludis]TDS10389.1 hypothetical protein B0I21_109154 [Sphingobacterium paludis]